MIRSITNGKYNARNQRETHQKKATKEKTNKVSIETINKAIQEPLSFIEDDDLKMVFESELSYRRNQYGEEKIHFSTQIASKQKSKNNDIRGSIDW